MSRGNRWGFPGGLSWSAGSPERVAVGLGRVDVSDPDNLVQGWFAVSAPESGVFTIEEPLHQERVKSYLVVGTERAVLIDTGMGVGDMRALVSDLTDRPVTVINSHAHWDHVGGNRAFTEILIHLAEAEVLGRGYSNERLQTNFAPERLLGALPESFDPSTVAFPPTPPTGYVGDGELLDLGGRVLEVIHAPGHSPGGIVLFDRAGRTLFSTDVAYPGALYCFGPDADLATYRETMKRLAPLSEAVDRAYPAHNASPMDPALLPVMRDALDAIAMGRAPDAIDDDLVIHEFGGFSVWLTADKVNGAS